MTIGDYVLEQSISTAACDDIEIAQAFAEMEVLSTMMSNYEKMIMIQENCECDISEFSIIQEAGSLLEGVKGFGDKAKDAAKGAGDKIGNAAKSVAGSKAGEAVKTAGGKVGETAKTIGGKIAETSVSWYKSIGKFFAELLKKILGILKRFFTKEGKLIAVIKKMPDDTTFKFNFDITAYRADGAKILTCVEEFIGLIKECTDNKREFAKVKDKYLNIKTDGTDKPTTYSKKETLEMFDFFADSAKYEKFTKILGDADFIAKHYKGGTKVDGDKAYDVVTADEVRGIAKDLSKGLLDYHKNIQNFVNQVLEEVSTKK